MRSSLRTSHRYMLVYSDMLAQLSRNRQSLVPIEDAPVLAAIEVVDSDSEFDCY